MNKNYILTFAIALVFTTFSNAQIYESMLGIKVGYNKAIALTAKIPLDRKNALEGSIGQFTPQPDYTVGATIAYHRHILLNELETWQAYYGLGITTVIGDERGSGAGLNGGIMYIHKRLNIGLDFYPVYFFNNETLGFRPLAGIYLRWVN